MTQPQASQVPDFEAAYAGLHHDWGWMRRLLLRSRGLVGGRSGCSGFRTGHHGSGCRWRSEGSWRRSLRLRRIGHRRHGALRIEQMVLTRSEAQADQRSRIRNGLALPAVVGLISAHRLFAGIVPSAGRLARQVMLADQSFLNCRRPLGIDFLLAAHAGRFPARGTLSRRFARRLLHAAGSARRMMLVGCR